MEFILDTLGKVGFEWKMGLFNLINFLIIFFILKKFLFKPITKTINERQKKANQAIDDFSQAKAELQMATQKSQEIIDNAKVEANKILEQSHDDAKVLADELKIKAKADIELLIEQAKKNIAIDKKEMKEELKKETAILVITALEKILTEKFDKETDEKYIEKMISLLK
ncbi:MAG: F0F1 ATP synthase subunit B [Candidatus Magasanikbacteria bacterium]|nr:F0F1 ATP synthase subunit B [Candidatus Magasanikbacteria bacterium]NCS72265.1 F0F1 ATP synthase subunit B [Candidatus Magasanikbacteria bacterium]